MDEGAFGGEEVGSSRSWRKMRRRAEGDDQKMKDKKKMDDKEKKKSKIERKKNQKTMVISSSWFNNIYSELLSVNAKNSNFVFFRWMKNNSEFQFISSELELFFSCLSCFLDGEIFSFSSSFEHMPPFFSPFLSLGFLFFVGFTKDRSEKRYKGWCVRWFC